MNQKLSTLLIAFFSISLSFLTFGQSTQQKQLEYYNSLGNATADYYESLPYDTLGPQVKLNCDLNKMVYGWHPYWVGNAYQNYQWDLLSHLSFFSYEVNSANGNAVSTHGWSTSAAVNAALASGNTKVTLCVTLFSSHTAFLTNATSKQTLITNLISLINSRGAHGVNIDFEGLPSSQATNFANFMVDLSNQMHVAIPGSEVSTVLYSVDWNSVFNFQIMEPAVDYYIIMGYGYYYSGSSTAGPNDPLYHFGTSYNYTLSRSITDYLKSGCPRSKLILGLPNYGQEWSTTSLNVPSSTTATGYARTYAYVRNNTSGNYSNGNHSYDVNSETDIYAFMNAGTPKQCFIAKENAFTKRLQHLVNAGIGGIGIWALGYDNGYMEFWNAIESKLTNCYVDSCSGTIHDFGGPTKNYYNNENYTWTIAPPAATSLDVNFSLFDVELNYDYLYIYDGNSISAAQIPGSPFTGTNSPGTFSTSTGAITFRFTSDISTVKPGFLATYTCNQDDVIPVTSISTSGNWQTQDFTATYTDTDNASISKRFSLVTDNNGTQRSGNRTLGYLFEDFSTAITNQWSTGLGNWSLSSGWLFQSSETETNSACYATLTQSSGNEYVYQWKGKIGGTGSNRRVGLHFFCSDPTLPNRGNSYLIYWRADTDKCQIYRSTSDNLVLQTNDDALIDPNIEYDFKILYNPATGLIKAYLNNVLVSSWTDPSPLTTGNSVSWRSGNCTYSVDDAKVYKSRTATQTVTVGTMASMVRYQNVNPITPNCKIYSLVTDNAENFSLVTSAEVNIDWTVPSNVVVNDGLGSDINVFVTPNEISANWTASSDSHSAINSYWVSVGTTSGAQDVVPFTNVALQTNFTFTGLSLTYGQIYFITVKAKNGAALETLGISSDGQVLQVPTNPPLANFQLNESIVCYGDSIQLINSSTNGTSFLWSVTNGTIQNPTLQDPYFIPTGSGNCQISLTATNSVGSDQIIQSFNITILNGPIASAVPDETNLALPNAIVLFSNSSQNSDSYFWDFGDGVTSIDENPWHGYSATGTYSVMLIATRDGCQNDTTYFTINVGNAGSLENVFQTISIFPNPFSNSLTIKGNNVEEVSLFDLQGKLIYYEKFDGSSKKIEILLKDTIEQGMYLIKVKDRGVNYSERLYKY